MEETKTEELPKSNNEKELPTEYDKCWSWFVLFGAFVILSTFGCSLLSRHWNFEIPELIDKSSRFDIYVHFIISILLIICYLIAPLSSLLIKLFGFTFVTVVGSFLAGISMLIYYFLLDSYHSNNVSRNISITIAFGIGFGLMYLSAITSVITYFRKLRPLAIGFTVCGLSEIIMVYKLNEFAFDKKVEIIVLTVIIFLCSLCGFIFRPIKVTKKTQNDTENSQVINNENTKSDTNNISKRFKEWISDMVSLFKNPVYIFFVVIWTFFSIAQRISYNYILFILSEFSRRHELDYFVLTIALSGFFGRILFGLIFSIPQLTQHRNKIFSLAIIVSGIVSAIIIPFNNLNVYTICLIVIFVLTSGSIGMLPVIVADLMKTKLFSNAFSLLLFFNGITMLFEYNLIYLVDNNHVEISLNIFGSIISLCGLLLFTIPTLQTKQEKRRVNSVYLQRL